MWTPLAYTARIPHTRDMNESAALWSLPTLTLVGLFLAHTGGFLSPILSTLSQNGF